MGGYILRRLFLVIPTLFGIMLINFALTQLVPGGPFDQIEVDARIASGIHLKPNIIWRDLCSFFYFQIARA